MTGGLHPLFSPEFKPSWPQSEVRSLRCHRLPFIPGKKVIVTACKAGDENDIDRPVDELNQVPGIIGKAVGIAANVAQMTDEGHRVVEITKAEGNFDTVVANVGVTWGGPFEPEDPGPQC